MLAVSGVLHFVCARSARALTNASPKRVYMITANPTKNAAKYNAGHGSRRFVHEIVVKRQVLGGHLHFLSQEECQFKTKQTERNKSMTIF